MTKSALPIWQELAIGRHTREALLRGVGEGVVEVDALVSRVASGLSMDELDVYVVLKGMIANGDLERVEVHDD